MAIFENNPHSGRNYANVGEALESLKAFNAIFALKQMEANDELCGNKDATAGWKKLIHEGVINAGGEEMELDFFEKIGGGKTETIDAKNLYFRYNSDIDMNVHAQEAAQAPTAGAPATFTLLKGNHSGGGKFSYPAIGYSIYIYEDRQWVQITDIDKGTDYGHRITVKPLKKAYKINIRRGKKMMLSPVSFVGGISSHKPTGSMQSLGYTNHIKPCRIRRDHQTPIDLMRGYEDVLQWAIMFDEHGNEVDSWETFNKTNARKDLKWAKNLIFYLGQSIDNPDLFGDGMLTADYSGFDGYIPTMHYGGGVVADYNAAVGYDLEADFEPTMLRNDALKRTNEYVVLHALPFWMALNRNAGEKFKNSTGAINFDTFKRMGPDAKPEDIIKLGVQSYKYGNFSLHFKQVGALSDTRGIGNYDFPYQANFIPGNGLRDSKGKEVPAIQYFVPKGMGASGMLEEVDVDGRKEGEMKDILKGYLAETLMMAIHCPHQHILANPKKVA